MFQIIFQHHDFIVVTKDENVNFHDEGDLGQGLFSQVKQKISAVTTPLEKSDTSELYPVHRLDKMTSGLMIFAKTKAAAQTFGQLFSEHKIEKYYIAISDKKPAKKQGLIKGDMAKSRRGMWKLLRSMENPAITQFFSYALTAPNRLYILKPHSGKTHQLRVALSSIGSPILGDEQYHAKTQVQNDRGYLHAYGLRFTYLEETYEFVAPPTSGEHFLEQTTVNRLNTLGKPWLLSWPKIKR